MKKVKMVIAALVAAVTVLSNGTVAHAAENGLTVVSAGNMEVKQLSEEEVAQLNSTLSTDTMVGENALELNANSSYTVYQYSDTFNFHLGDTWVAAADIVCIVYRYSDGKVHLYSRDIDLRRVTYYDAYITYGSIVNTDGSVCYTTGDRVTVYDYYNMWTFAIDFAATPTGQSFTCYEIDY